MKYCALNPRRKRASEASKKYAKTQQKNACPRLKIFQPRARYKSQNIKLVAAYVPPNQNFKLLFFPAIFCLFCLLFLYGRLKFGVLHLVFENVFIQEDITYSRKHHY